MVNIPPKVMCKYISLFSFAMNSPNYFPRNLDNIGYELHDLSKKKKS